MTRTKRVIDVLFGIVMIIAGLAFFGSSVEASVWVMLVLIGLGITLRGLQTLYYYLTMAKYMVGGKNVLYRSFILLDLGALGGSLAGHGLVYAVSYLALLHASSGLISIVRANESRLIGAHWRLKMAYGVTNVLMAVAVIIGTIILKEPRITIYIYGSGLIYTGILRIASAFRRTRIVYIQ